ncbi:lysoplasmalogenase [Pontimicrobium sp. SW4]|uniref:Lysoplasmalogenase n=1 Tax=Pontimicrobium sp. SW4 TaxID=3153519 RepID=A0AAU7BVJ1_9FLAO
MQFSKTEKSFTLLFSIIVIIELITSSISSLQTLHYAAKPLILVSLTLFFYKNGNHLNRKTWIIMLFALIFSLVGDVLLMFVDMSASFFLGGLVAFLLAHIMYILAFIEKRNRTHKPLSFIIILLIYASGLFYILKDGLGDMLIPVIVYIFIILTMAITASLRKNSVMTISYSLVLIGALFFVASDSLLALNKFYSPIPSSNISIMLTYALAQYCIVLGILKQIK